MTEKVRVKAAATHSPNGGKVAAPVSEFGTENHQKPQMLIDPEDAESGFTHTSENLKFKEPKRVAASAHDPEDNSSGPTHSDKMPVIDTAPAIEASEDEDEDFGELVESEFDDLDEAEDETVVEAEDEMGELEVDEEHSTEDMEPEIGEADAEVEVEEPFEVETPADEAVALVDVDAVPESDDTELQFATIAANVHIIRGNRIIASMGKANAKKCGVADVYLTSQFQDVVQATVESRGLRKGLVQSGFVLAKVTVANKAQSKLVEAKVAKQLATKVELSAKKEKAMEQCLAIAAVGINRRFFKDSNNELKAGLETELLRAGVRGGPNIVRAMFAQHGVSYAKAILTLANKISNMPEEVRNQYASALDMTEDNFEPDEVDAETEVEEEFEDLPTSVSAALLTPVRRDRGVLLGSKTSASAFSILNGSQSLV